MSVRLVAFLTLLTVLTVCVCSPAVLAKESEMGGTGATKPIITPKPHFKDSEDGVSAIVSLIKVLLTVFEKAGAVLLVYAVGKLVFAMKDENPESKMAAATILAVSIVLVGIETVLMPLFVAFGIAT